jgi:hypothetical protein
MQRWMQAKMQLAAKHGTTRSGCNRPMGGVWDDIDIGYIEPKNHPIKERHIERHGNRIVEVSPVKRQIKGTVVVLRDDAPVAWGKGRKARRAAQFNI